MNICALVLLLAACSREQPAASSSAPAAPPPATASATPPATTSATPPVLPVTPQRGTYDQAMTWLKSTSGFRFAIDEGGVHADGVMHRKTVGSESIEARVNGQEWRAAASARGVRWERRSGGSWKAADAPPFGNRLYQRATLAFDPQKIEGNAQFVGAEGTTNHYRFTDANTGNVHDVWVRQSDSHIEKMTIGDVMEMTIRD